MLKRSSAKYGQAASSMETLLFLFYLKISPGRRQMQSQVITKQLSFFPAEWQSCFEATFSASHEFETFKEKLKKTKNTKHPHAADHGNQDWRVVDQLATTMGGFTLLLVWFLVTKSFSNETWNLAFREMSS